MTGRRIGQRVTRYSVLGLLMERAANHSIPQVSDAEFPPFVDIARRRAVSRPSVHEDRPWLHVSQTWSVTAKQGFEDTRDFVPRQSSSEGGSGLRGFATNAVLLYKALHAAAARLTSACAKIFCVTESLQSEDPVGPSPRRSQTLSPSSIKLPVTRDPLQDLGDELFDRMEAVLSQSHASGDEQRLAFSAGTRGKSLVCQLSEVVRSMSQINHIQNLADDSYENTQRHGYSPLSLWMGERVLT